MRYAYLQTTMADGRMFFPYGDEPLKTNTETFFVAHVYEGDAPVRSDARPLEVTEFVWKRHNVGDASDGNRPRGQEIRSMVIGDFVVVWSTPGWPRAYWCAPNGFDRVRGETADQLILIADRKAHGVLRTAELLQDLQPQKVVDVG